MLWSAVWKLSLQCERVFCMYKLRKVHKILSKCNLAGSRSQISYKNLVRQSESKSNKRPALTTKHLSCTIDFTETRWFCEKEVTRGGYSRKVLDFLLNLVGRKSVFVRCCYLIYFLFLYFV